MEVVRAAGGLVTRPGEAGTELLVVHRPKYDDWTLPKGKCEPGETDEECALREVEEETGLRCELGPELATTRYTDSSGRPKVVRYFGMQAASGSFAPHREVDEVRWLTAADAAGLLSYERDRNVVRSLGDG